MSSAVMSDSRHLFQLPPNNLPVLADDCDIDGVSDVAGEHLRARLAEVEAKLAEEIALRHDACQKQQLLLGHCAAMSQGIDKLEALEAANVALQNEQVSLKVQLAHARAALTQSQDRQAPPIARRTGSSAATQGDIASKSLAYIEKSLEMDAKYKDKAEVLAKGTKEIIIKSMLRDYKQKHGVGLLAELISDVFQNGVKFGPTETCAKATSKAHKVFALLLAGVCQDTDAQDRLLREFIDVNIARLPKMLSREAKLKVIKPYADRLQEMFEAASLRNFMCENISTRTWDRMAQRTCTKFDAVSQSYVPDVVDGMLPPVLPNSHQLSKWAKELCDEAQFKYDPTTKVASVDFHAAILSALQSLDTQRLGAQKQPIQLNRVITINLKADSANCGNGHNITPFCFSLPLEALAANSPKETYTFFLYDGSDAQQALKVALGNSTLEQLRSLKNTTLIYKGQPITFEVVESGDLKYISSSVGHSGCAHACPCPLCECTRANLAVDGQYQARTSERIQLLSHTAPVRADGSCHTCPGCEVRITPEVIAEAVRLSESDAPADITARRQFASDHFGIQPGIGSLLGTDPSRDIAICLLHCLLNIMACMWKFSIGFVADNETAKALVLLLKDKRVQFKPATTLEEFRKALLRKSLNGPECQTFFDCKDAVLELCFARGNQVTKLAMSALIAQWERLWIKLKQVDDNGDRVAQAESIRVDAVALRDEYMKVAACENSTLYFHMLTHDDHIPRMIRRFGNLSKYSGQGMENGHSISKKMLATVATRAHYPRDILKRKFTQLQLSRFEAEKQSVEIRRQMGLPHRKTKVHPGVKKSDIKTFAAQRRVVFKITALRKNIVMKKEPLPDFLLET